MLTKNQINEQLTFTKDLIEQLKPYFEREVKELPTEIIDKIKTIKVGPQITTSGLEKVNNILLGLYVAENQLEDAYSDPEGFKKRNSSQPVTPAQKTTVKPAIKPSTTPTTPVSEPQPVAKIPIKIKPALRNPIAVPKPIQEKIKIQIKPLEPKAGKEAITSEPSPVPPSASKIEL